MAAVLCGISLTVVPAARASEPTTAPSPAAIDQSQPPTETRDPSTVTADQGATISSLDADAAVRLALDAAPLLQSLSLEAQAARAEERSGGRWQNPELAVEWEEFGISRPLWRQSDLTVSIEQQIPLGSEGSASRRLAGLRAQRLDSRTQLAAVELATRAREAHLAALAEQARVELLSESLSMAQQVLDSVRAAIAVGQSAPADERLALAEYRSEEVALGRARARLEGLKAVLASLWGGLASDVGPLAGSLEPSPVDSMDTGSPGGQGSPLALAPAARLQQEKQAELELERQRTLPALTVMGGVRGMDGFADQAIVAGLSIPLPAWNRNQSEIEAASLQVRRARAALRAREREWTQAVTQERAVAYQAWQEYQGIRDGVLPELDAGLASVLTAFQAGDARSLDVLDAQRRVLAARLQLVDLAEAAIAASIRLDGLLKGADGANNPVDSRKLEVDTEDQP